MRSTVTRRWPWQKEGKVIGIFSGFFSDYKKLSTGAGRYAGEFDAWQPIKSYAAGEEPGDPASRISDALRAVDEKEVPKATAPKQDFFEDIAKRVWKAATPTRGMDIFARKDFLGAQRRVQPGPQPVGKPRPGEPLFEREPLFPDDTWQAPRGPRPPLVSPTAPKPGYDYLKGVAKDWQLAKDLKRISGYTFRGDSREPHLVMKAGGFVPNNLRADDFYLKKNVYSQFITYMQRRFKVDLSKEVPVADFLKAVNASKAEKPHSQEWWNEYEIWRAIEAIEELHTGRMVADQFLKAYTSTSRDVLVAKGFAGDEGWVYVVYVEGGMVIPEHNRHEWTHIFNEQEIAYPGRLPWANIYGFRKKDGVMFARTEPVLLRKGFQQKAPEAFKQCYAFLSGKSPHV